MIDITQDNWTAAAQGLYSEALEITDKIKEADVGVERLVAELSQRETDIDTLKASALLDVSTATDSQGKSLYPNEPARKAAAHRVLTGLDYFSTVSERRNDVSLRLAEARSHAETLRMKAWLNKSMLNYITSATTRGG